MSDVATSIGAIQSWISSVESAFATVQGELASPSPTTSFASILSNLQGLLGGGSASGASMTPSTSAVTLGQQAMLTSALSSSSLPAGGDVVNAAMRYLGVPYVWGGTTPSGFDCSGFVQYVFGQLGISLPRTSEEQATAGVAVTSLATAEPGDLVFYAGSDGTPSSPGHVGIYLGNGEMIDAPQTGENVSIQPVGQPVAIRRVLIGPSGTSAAGSPAEFAPLFQQAASRYGIPASLLSAIAQVESNFNPSAESSAGAEGLMQLMPETAASLGIDPFDPVQAINGAAQLLAGYLQRFKSVPLAVAAYNAGAGAVEQYGGIPPYAETENYVQAVTTLMGASS